jgi:hypothetical protein
MVGMATILEFKAAIPVVGTAAAGLRKQPASAELILFPGVRYERHDSFEYEAVSEPVKRRSVKKGQRHEVLELID